MAPEQARGEAVDQRADVFAIGAMLRELCALPKVPPADLAQRHRMLRRAGIDPDLISIIDKALQADVALRYGDAGALATDLKPFKSGARIAARDYSPWAILGHAMRRSIIAAVALTACGSSSSCENIAAQRDRADGALISAHQERDRAYT